MAERNGRLARFTHVRLLLLAIGVTWVASGEDVKEIFRRAVEKDERNYAVRDQYTFREESVVEFLDKDGRTKSVERRTKEVLFYDGTQLERLVAKDGKPLSEKEAQKEKERIDREIAKMKRASPSARAKRRGESAAALKEETEGRRQVMEAFDLTMKGEQVVAGRPCWLIHGKPRVGYQPKGRRADQLKKFQGDACIDKVTSDWMRLEMETTDTISFGLFVLRLQPGASVKLEQTRVNDEVCFPSKIDIAASARLLGMMKRVRVSVRYSDFKKFATDSTITFETPQD